MVRGILPMPIINTEEGYSHVDGRGLELFITLQGLEVEDGGMRVFHANSPALHGADPEADTIILALVGMLCEARGISDCRALPAWQECQTFSVTGSDRV